MKKHLQYCNYQLRLWVVIMFILQPRQVFFVVHYRMRHTLIIISLLTISCSQNSLDKKRNQDAETVNLVDTTLKSKGSIVIAKTEPVQKFEFQKVRFEIEKYYPKVSDTSNFIKALENNCHLYSNESNNKHLEKFKKIKLKGSTNTKMNYNIVQNLS